MRHGEHWHAHGTGNYTYPELAVLWQSVVQLNVEKCAPNGRRARCLEWVVPILENKKNGNGWVPLSREVWGVGGTWSTPAALDRPLTNERRKVARNNPPSDEIWFPFSIGLLRMIFLHGEITDSPHGPFCGCVGPLEPSTPALWHITAKTDAPRPQIASQCWRSQPGAWSTMSHSLQREQSAFPARYQHTAGE